jgi:plasmid stability protein
LAKTASILARTGIDRPNHANGGNARYPNPASTPIDIKHIKCHHSDPLKGECALSAVTVRNLPEATHRALKLRAAQHGRSTEAEIRLILENAVAPKIGLGTTLMAIGQELGDIELDFPRDKRPVEPASFE